MGTVEKKEIITVTENEYNAITIIKEKYSNKEIFNSKNSGINGTVLGNLSKKNLIIRINQKTPYNYQYISQNEIQLVKKEKKKTSSNDGRANNQWIGKYFELCSTDRINGNEIPPDPTLYKSTSGYNFTEEEKKELFKQAIAIKNHIGEGHHAEWVGDHTVKGTGDIILDNKWYIEIKHVAEGNSTYHNTSIHYFDRFGFNFNDYLNKYNFRQYVQELCPDIKVSFDNLSFFTKDDAIEVQDNRPDVYKKLKLLDDKIRKEFTADIINFFKQNPKEMQQFYTDMAFKYKEKGEKVNLPDRYIVYNYTTNIIHEINLDTIISTPAELKKVNPLGFRISELKFQLGWQNRIGYNPTIRVFIP